MSYYINYSLSYSYKGRIKVYTDDLDKAIKHVEEMDPELLKHFSDESTKDLKTKPDTLIDERQLALFLESCGDMSDD